MVDKVDSSSIGDMSFRRTETGGIKINQKMDGLNVGEVVEALYETRLADRDPYQSKIDKRTEMLSALSNFETLTKGLKGAAERLRASDISGKESSFGKLTSLGRSDTDTPPDQIIGVEFTDGTAIPQTFKIEVTQRASRDIATSDTGSAAKTTALGLEGTLTLGIAGGATHAFEITDDMSLERLVREINNQSATTVVTSQIFQFAPDDFRLEFQAVKEGGVISIEGADGLEDNIGGGQIIPGASGNTAEDLRVEFTLNDVAMTRTTNTISDIYDGIKIELRQAEEDIVIEVDIVRDTTTIRKDIEDLVSVYNEAIKFIQEQRVRSDDGTPKEGAVLSSNPLMRTVFQEISSIVSQKVQGLTGDYQSLADIGISSDGLKLTVDASVLESEIDSDTDAVRKIFDFDATSSNQAFDVATAPEKWVSELEILDGDETLIKSATVTLNKSDEGNFSATFTFNEEEYEADINVYGDYVYINGKEGTPFHGMVVVFTGAESMDDDSSQNTTITGTQGVGSRLRGALDKMLTPYTGDFSLERDKVEVLNQRDQERIERVE
ncbi:Flagellar hook-associated protein 2, partial [Stylophora pistillata]